MIVNNKDKIVVWFSCGAASAVAAKKIINKYPSNTIFIVNNPVKEEDEDNRRFLKDIESWLGVPIQIATNPDYPSCSARDVWSKRKFMSSPLGAPCTVQLKKRARQHWENNNQVDWHVLGFTSEEKNRYERFILTERENVLPILIDENLTKQDCIDLLQKEKIKLPRVYSLGYPNANCIGCVKATSPTYWNHVRKINPEVFRDRAEQSRELGVKLTRVKGKRIFLDELDPNYKGQSIRTMNIECGIFCEEK